MKTPEATPTPDFDALVARRFVRPQVKHVDVWLVGCGGTGGWLAPALVRITRDCPSADVSLTFVDFDHVEEHNLLRQNFCEAEIGENKAERLSERYGLAWGVEIAAVPEPFKADMIERAWDASKHTLVVGCVDNAAARLEIRRALRTNQRGISWLDCGNFDMSGQVVIGNAAEVNALAGAFPFEGMCVRLPDTILLYPNLAKTRQEETSKRRAKMSCEALQAANYQALMVNQMAASIAGQYVIGWLNGTLKHFMTTFNFDSGSVRSRWITPEGVAAAIPPKGRKAFTTAIFAGGVVA